MDCREVGVKVEKVSEAVLKCRLSLEHRIKSIGGASHDIYID
jgi:hypothetical protein